MKKFSINFVITAIVFSICSVIIIYFLYEYQLDSLESRLHDEYKQVYIENKKYHVKDIVNHVLNHIEKIRKSEIVRFENELKRDVLLLCKFIEHSNIKDIDDVKKIIKNVQVILPVENRDIFVARGKNFIVKPEKFNFSISDFSGTNEGLLKDKNYFIFWKRSSGYVIGIVGDYNLIENKVKQMVLKDLSNFRYESDRSGYLIILKVVRGDDSTKTFLLLNPNSSESVGKEIPLNLSDKFGKEFHKEILAKCLSSGEGIVSYYFNIPGTNKIGEKVTYVKFYNRWNWIIGTGFYLDMFREKLNEKNKLLRSLIFNYNIKFLFLLIGVFSLLLFTFIFFVMKNIKRVNNYIKKTKESEKFKEILIDLIPKPLFVLDSTGKLIDVNKSFENFFGVNKHETIHENKNYENIEVILDYLHKNVLKNAKDSDFGESVHKISLKLPHSKEVQTIEIHNSLISLEDEFLGLVGIIFDITEQQKLTDELYHKSIKDDLTGAYNRRYLSVIFEREIYRVVHENEESSVIMFDLDFFKKINDKYGHNVGDIVLKKVADLVKRSIRKSDYFFRIGGEEFLILLPGSSKEIAYNIAEKLRKIISEYKFDNGVVVTISFGVTDIQKTDTLEVLLKRVDIALYESKNSGRNKGKMI